MNATNTKLDELREELKDPEMSEGYAESFLDSYIATQIKVLREQHKLSQQNLAEQIGSKQGAISRIENVNYSKWNVTTLKKLARVFRVRLKVSFETYGSLLAEVDAFTREGLQRTPRESDKLLNSTHPLVKPVVSNPTPYVHRVGRSGKRSRRHRHPPPSSAGNAFQFGDGAQHANKILGSGAITGQIPPRNSAQNLTMEAIR